MKANVKLIRTQRKFSKEFKVQLVKEYESGTLSIPQLSNLNGITPQTLYEWVYKFSTFNKKGFRIIEMSKSSSQKVKDLENRIKELERMVGQKQIMIDYLDTLIDVAKDELDIDIKKNFNTPQSKDVKTTKKK